MLYGRDFEWIDPFAQLEDMARYVREREDEATERLHWALGEVGRHRSMVDTALLDAINRYAPSLQFTPMSATLAMDDAIARRMTR